MSANEIGIEQARKSLGDLADAAHHRGQVTIITRHGRAYAAITPIKEPAMTPAAIAAQIKSLYGDLKTALDTDLDTVLSNLADAELDAELDAQLDADLHAVLTNLADAQFNAADAVRQIMQQTSGDTADHAQSAALTLTNAGSDLMTAADHAQPTTA